jgi:nicotinate phosphoribosyltransferase
MACWAWGEPRSCPEDAVFLVDTHDALGGVAQAIEATAILAAEGITVSGIRIDSGDLAPLAWAARRLLDGAGLEGLQILVSGGLDEPDVAALVAAGAPIDGFGVGTRLLTSHDCPSLDEVYKLVRDRQGPRRKTSPGKETLPDAKQVFRFSAGGRFQHDSLALAAEPVPAGAEPLLQLLAMIQARLWHGLAALPDPQRSLADG